MTTPDPTNAERDARERLRAYMEQDWTPKAGRLYAPHSLGMTPEAALDLYATAILASRDTAWRAAIEGMEKEHGAGCIEDEYGWICVCGGNDWNAALSALADRMGEAE